MQPYGALSQLMQSRANRLRRIRATGRKLAAVMELRSTGQVGWRVNHSVMQLRQKACSQTPAYTHSRSIRGEEEEAEDDDEKQK